MMQQTTVYTLNLIRLKLLYILPLNDVSRYDKRNVIPFSDMHTVIGLHRETKHTVLRKSKKF